MNTAAVAGVELGSRDPEALAAFYCEAFGFVASADSTTLDLGGFTLRLRRTSSVGRAMPEDSHSNDLWFRHLAIVVRDMETSWAALERFGLDSISDGAQVLPKWNPSAADIEARYFRDPEGHPLELIRFPPDKGNPRWHEDRSDRIFLGVDHTAIAVLDTAASVEFYAQYGLAPKAESGLNSGIEQARLSGVADPRVEITRLDGADGPGLELLEYLQPRNGRRPPPDSTPDDLWFASTLVSRAAASLASSAVDPDGHGIRLARQI